MDNDLPPKYFNRTLQINQKRINEKVVSNYKSKSLDDIKMENINYSLKFGYGGFGDFYFLKTN